MAKRETYLPRSIIYSPKDKIKQIYRLEKGLVELVLELEKDNAYRKQIMPASFFAIESSILGNLPQETARVINESIVTIYDIDEFKELLLNDRKSMVSALQSLSGKLRNLHTYTRKLTGEINQENPLQGLLQIGEELYQSSEFKQAQYVFETYLNQYPRGQNKERVKKLLKNIRTSVPYRTADLPPLKTENPVEKISVPSEIPSVDHSERLQTPVKQTMLAARRAFNNRQYESTVLLLEKILHRPEQKYSDSMIQEAYMYKGIAEWHLKKYDQSIITLSHYLMTYPHGIYARHSMLQLGMLLEKNGNPTKALYFYERILKTPNGQKHAHDEIYKKAKVRIEQLK